MNPDNAEHGGGPPPDGNYLIQAARFELFDYPLRQQGPLPPGQRACSLYVAMLDDAGQVFEQRYSVGNEQNYVPTADGENVQQVGQRGLNDNSGAYHFFKGLAGKYERRAWVCVVILVNIRSSIIPVIFVNEIPESILPKKLFGISGLVQKVRVSVLDEPLVQIPKRDTFGCGPIQVIQM